MAKVFSIPGLGLISAVFCAFGGLAHASPPDCPRTIEPMPLLSKAGTLESLAFDQTGRLLFTDLSKDTLNVLPGPGLSASVVASGIESPGGIAPGSGSEVFVGFGNDVLSGLVPAQGRAGVVKVDLRDGRVQAHARGLAGSNGLVRAPDGTLYASNALASYLGRVLPDGTVQPRWLHRSGNGLALSADGKVLYLNQSLPARIWRVDVSAGVVSPLAEAPWNLGWAFFDGLGASSDGRLFVAVYLAGQVWQVDDQGHSCVLARGLSRPSAVVAGQAGRGFKPTSLYVTTHSGSLLELPDAIKPR